MRKKTGIERIETLCLVLDLSYECKRELKTDFVLDILIAQIEKFSEEIWSYLQAMERGET